MENAKPDQEKNIHITVIDKCNAHKLTHKQIKQAIMQDSTVQQNSMNQLGLKHNTQISMGVELRYKC